MCRGQPTKPPTGHHRLVALMTLAKEVDLVNVGNSALVKRYGVVDFAMQVGDRTKVGFKPSHLYCTLGWVGFVGFLKKKKNVLYMGFQTVQPIARNGFGKWNDVLLFVSFFWSSGLWVES